MEGISRAEVAAYQRYQAEHWEPPTGDFTMQDLADVAMMAHTEQYHEGWDWTPMFDMPRPFSADMLAMAWAAHDDEHRRNDGWFSQDHQHATVEHRHPQFP